jgi:hypothetical protein
MEKTSMSPDKTQEPNSEQLLKLLEMQVASARERRLARDASRGKAGTIGLVVIVAGAAIALWMLSLLLEQMRPQHGGRMEGAGAATNEAAR